MRYYATTPGSSGDDSNGRKPATTVELRESIWTIPNALTFSRMIATPFIGSFIVHGQYTTAVWLLAAAGMTDLVDGWLARRYNMGSVAGSLLDPAADKLLVSTLTICLTLSPEPFNMPVWLAGVILGRDVWLMGLAAWWRFSTLSPPKTITRYFDLSIPSAQVHPTTISKVNTALQITLLGAYVLTPALLESGVVESAVDAATTAGQQGHSENVDLARTLLDYFGYLVATTTVWSGIGYIGNKNAVKVFRKAE